MPINDPAHTLWSVDANNSSEGSLRINIRIFRGTEYLQLANGKTTDHTYKLCHNFISYDFCHVSIYTIFHPFSFLLNPNNIQESFSMKSWG